VPPPRLFPVLPPREFDPTLLLGVALGITPDRFRSFLHVQNCSTAVRVLIVERSAASLDPFDNLPE
jgi:hypothetical protein